jgi:hypothetical protein
MARSDPCACRGTGSCSAVRTPGTDTADCRSAKHPPGHSAPGSTGKGGRGAAAEARHRTTLCTPNIKNR